MARDGDEAMADELIAVMRKFKCNWVLLKAIYAAARKHWTEQGKSIGLRFEANIRNKLQRHCSQCAFYEGKRDLFRMRGDGAWALKERFNVLHRMAGSTAEGNRE